MIHDPWPLHYFIQYMALGIDSKKSQIKFKPPAMTKGLIE